MSRKSFLPCLLSVAHYFLSITGSASGCSNLGNFAEAVKKSLPPMTKILQNQKGENALKQIPGDRQAELQDLGASSTQKSKEPPPRFKLKSCAVVGNGGILRMSRFGEAIDSHKTIFRVNQAPTIGYEQHVGSRTTFRLLNKLWAQKYLAPRPYFPRSSGTVLILARSKNLAELRRMKRVYHASSIHVAQSSYDVAMASREIFNAFKRRLTCARKYKPGGGETPTTGLYAVTAALSMCERVTVYGFGNGPKGLYQYYQLKGTERTSGNPVHSFNIEKALVEELARGGLIEICHGASGANCGLQGMGSSERKGMARSGERKFQVASSSREMQVQGLGIVNGAGSIRAGGKV